jgi:mercuric reductase
MQKRVIFEVSGMSCDHCADTIHKKLDIKGVIRRNVSYPEGKADIAYNTSEISKDELVEIINSIDGYRVAGEQELEKDSQENIMRSQSKRDSKKYSLLIIGGGSAAFAAALRTSEMGGDVLMINDGLPIGGTCVNVGCIPSKTLIRAGEANFHASHMHFDGIEAQSQVSDFKRVVQQQKELVADMRQHKYVDVISDDPNIQLIHGRGRMISDHAVEIDGKIYKGENIMIATGAGPFIPDIPGIREIDYLTNESAYELDDKPDHLVILGGRYVGLENAQMFRRLGVKVTVLQRSERILPTEDPDITRDLSEYLEDEGITIVTGVKLKRVYPVGDEVVLKITHNGTEQIIKGSHIMVATGRKGNTGSLNLDEVGIHTNDRGYIPVDDTLRTNKQHIFAVGDVTGEQQFVYTAAYEGNLAAENAMTKGQKKKDYRVLPWVIFTDPQLAGVGMDEREAKEAGIDFEVAKLPLDQVPRAMAARDTRGFIKLLRNKKDDKLIGARILAPEGSELLMELSLAMRYGITITELASELHPYLTLSEAIKLTALTFQKDVSKLSCCAV